MTRRQWLVIALGAVAVVAGGVVIGFAIGSRPPPSESPSPSGSVGIECTVSATPDTILVDPDTGDSDDVVFVAGTGFPGESAVSIYLPETVVDVVTTAAGGFTVEIAAAAGVTHPEPPDIEAGLAVWNITGWDAPEAPGDFGSVPPRACQAQVSVTLELTHEPSPTPPSDLSAGGYAEILADGVRVRVEPSLDSTVVGALFTGDVVRILAPAQVVEGLTWYRVESVLIQSGQQVRGYIAAGADGEVYLRPTVEPPPTPTPGPSPSPSPS